MRPKDGGWRVRIHHASGYRYGDHVSASYNEARLIPQTNETQLTVDARVETSPPSRIYRYWDYWGTLVSAFDLHVPHDELLVTGSSVVETAGASPRPPEVSWADVRNAASGEWVELATPTPSTVVDEELTEIARELARPRGPHHAALAAAEWVHDALVYEPGTTGVHTTAVDAWRARRGVCQDFAHLALALLRCMGLPARYVSGYLHPAPDADVGETLSGQSHAWVSWWVGEWWAYDPTNFLPAGRRHIVVAQGREYADVLPMKGVYVGGPARSLGVTVEATRLA